MKRAALALIFVAMSAAFGMAQQGAAAEKFQLTDILITSYKGPATVDPVAYHNSKAGKDFEAELQSDDDERFCLQAPHLEKATGLWKDTVEPSYWIHANARPTEAEAYAAAHAKKHQQDAVLVFERAADGPDTEYMLTWTGGMTVDGVVFAAVRRAGFDGATLANNKLLIVDPKTAHLANADLLAKALAAQLFTLRGHVRLLNESDFQKVLALYDAFPHSCPAQH